ncbi:M48 family metalloprotease [Vibrio mangrovi]|uniref:M48 family metalloprotease n=1 Tax=Vibrio mangrovi TaxID=474394 RepID=A0A1Y6IZC5_9VIBR|nr:M48 family metalloprotease [Vibrio mangrovi]MDW6002314.1 M48 family metalloprotease [Vibrio mangrovi]SMS03025.1 Protease HtpX [Vibrio mangrovi]
MPEEVEVRIDQGIPLPILVGSMFALTLASTYFLAFIAVIIYVQSHTNWLGIPSPREMDWAIRHFFGAATLFTIAALIYGLYSISDAGTDSTFIKLKGEPLSDEEREMFERFFHDPNSSHPSHTGSSHPSFNSSKIVKFISNDINAWALGSIDHGYMSFSTTSLELPEEQIKGIFLHEFGHLVSNDSKKMTFAKSFQNALVSFAMITPLKNFLKFTIFILTQLVLMKVSREREYRADQFAVHIDEDNGIVSALQSIKTSKLELVDYGDAKVYMFSLPNIDSMFATHPPLENRIARLTKSQIVSPTE